MHKQIVPGRFSSPAKNGLGKRLGFNIGPRAPLRAFRSDKQKEKKIFLAISKKIQQVENDITIVACCEALCGVRPIKNSFLDFVLLRTQILLMKNDIM